MKEDLVNYLEDRSFQLGEIIHGYEEEISFLQMAISRHEKKQEWNMRSRKIKRKQTVLDIISRRKEEREKIEKLLKYSKDLP